MVVTETVTSTLADLGGVPLMAIAALSPDVINAALRHIVPEEPTATSMPKFNSTI